MQYASKPCRCIVGRAIDDSGEPLRARLEAIKAADIHADKKILGILEEHGYKCSPRMLQVHWAKHAPWVRTGKLVYAQEKAIIEEQKLEKRRVAAVDALQEIVDRGHEKILSGEMPVTENLYIKSLQEMNRSAEGSAKNIFMNFGTIMAGGEKKELEGEVVDGEILDGDS